MSIATRFNRFVEAANSTNSNLDKQQVVSQFSDLSDVFRAVLNPFDVYGVTSKNIEKNQNIISDTSYDDVFDLFNDLSNRVITGHAAIGAVNKFIQDNPEYKNLVYAILDRNLGTRTSEAIINKVIPGCVPEFNVALANKYDPDKSKVNFDKQSWIAERKLDGVRCLAVCKNNDVKFFSRAGKEFETLGKVKELLSSTSLINNNIVLDGEICMVNEDGSDNFQGIMKEIRKKDHTIRNVKFIVFDLLTVDQAFNNVETKPYEERLEKLNILVKKIDSPTLSVAWNVKIKNTGHFDEVNKMAIDKGWEGLIIRKADSKYEAKRTNNLLKVKTFHDAEYVVENIEYGDIRHIVDGKEITSNMMSNVVITHRGNKVSVGSGFSIDERIEFKNDPSKIVGKTITVKYFEESLNQDGNYSLRFPTVKTIHGNEREV